jgi:hypothetical protein
VKRQGIADPAQAWGQCAIESFDLAEKQGYSLIRVTGLTYPQREHWACLTGDPDTHAHVIDLTARQFTVTVPARYETDMATWLDDACEWLGDSLNYEIYGNHDRDTPMISDWWIRDDIDPETFQREEAWRTP